MKILFVANVGKEHIIKFHLPSIIEFKNRGWEVDVACSGEDVVPFCDHQFIMKWKRSPFNFSLLIGIHQLRKIINSNHYDVIYCHTPVGGLAARLASKKARKKGAKVIYFAHGFHFYKGAPFLNWMIYPIEKYLTKYTDAIFLLNNEDFELAQTKFKRPKVKKLFPGIGINFKRLGETISKEKQILIRQSLGIQKDDIVLTYVAEINKNKNQIYLLHVLKHLLLFSNKFKLMLIGPDYSKGNLTKFAIKNGIYNNVVFTGWRSDIGPLLYSSDIYVASSIREGLGLNLIEAMYCHLPVVATKNRGHSSIINNQENGYLVSLDEPQKMADYILEIVGNKDLKTKFSNVNVLRYDSSVIARDIVDTIESLV